MGLLILAGVLILLMPGDKTVAFGGSFVVDRFSRFPNCWCWSARSARSCYRSSSGDLQRRKFEYPILILLSTTGMLMLTRRPT